jgi:hypothetical protein
VSSPAGRRHGVTEQRLRVLPQRELGARGPARATSAATRTADVGTTRRDIAPRRQPASTRSRARSDEREIGVAIGPRLRADRSTPTTGAT